MPITLVLPGDADVRFAGSPLVELAWAWHVLVGVDHHPERSAWADEVREALPADVHTGLEAWSFAVRAVRSTVLVDPTAVPGTRWADQRAHLNGMPGTEFAAMMLRPLLRIRGRRGPVVRDQVLALARARGTGAVRAVESMMD